MESKTLAKTMWRAEEGQYHVDAALHCSEVQQCQSPGNILHLMTNTDTKANTNTIAKTRKISKKECNCVQHCPQSPENILYLITLRNAHLYYLSLGNIPFHLVPKNHLTEICEKE